MLKDTYKKTIRPQINMTAAMQADLDLSKKISRDAKISPMNITCEIPIWEVKNNMFSTATFWLVIKWCMACLSSIILPHLLTPATATTCGSSKYSIKLSRWLLRIPQSSNFSTQSGFWSTNTS